MKFRYMILSALVSCLFVAACAKNRPKDAKSASKGNIENVDKGVNKGTPDADKQSSGGQGSAAPAASINVDNLKSIALRASDSCAPLDMKIDETKEDKVEKADLAKLALSGSWQLNKIEAFYDLKLVKLFQ